LKLVSYFIPDETDSLKPTFSRIMMINEV